MAQPKQKVVVITGCSSGVGHATALLFAKDPSKRFKVYATMRNLGKRELLEKDAQDELGKTLFVEKLDVSCEEDINRFVDDILAKEERIDVLVNNAGIGWFGPLENHSSGSMKEIFATNAFGPILLTQKILPHWKKHDYGHVIAISSISGIAAFPLTAVYNASKFAMEGFFESVALECMNFKGIKVSIIEPGPVISKFGENNDVEKLNDYLEKTDQTTCQTLKKMFENLGVMFQGSVQSGEDIGKVILEAVMSNEPHLRYSTNPLFDAMLKAKYADLDGDKGLKAVCELFHGKIV